MLERYKKVQDGVMKMVLLLESSPLSKQKKIVEVGMKGDQSFMNDVLSNIITWDDVTALDGLPLGELLYIAKANVIAAALYGLAPEIADRFLKACKQDKMGLVKDGLEYPKSTEPAVINTARMELMKNYRALVATKKIPQPKKNPEDIKKRMGF
jgi:hypothetical protein